MIKIIKEGSPDKKVKVKEVTVKDYPKTKEYDMVVQEEPLIPDVFIEPVEKDVIVVENKDDSRNKTVILSKEKEPETRKPVERFETVTKEELTPEVQEVLTKVEK